MLVDYHSLFNSLFNSFLSLISPLIGFWLLRPLVTTYVEQKVKAVHNRELEQFKSGLQYRLSKKEALLHNRVYVTQAHFDVELAAMKELFDLLSRAYLLLNSVRPVMDTSTADEAESKARLLERLNPLNEAANQLLSRMEALSPFLIEPIYLAMTEAFAGLRTELWQCKLGHNFGEFQWYENAKENSAVVAKARQTASNAIRDRVASLAVIA